MPKLSSTQLRRRIDPAQLGIETTESLQPLEGIIGQPRAVAALEFGLGMDAMGYNIYVAGEPGIGKMTAVRSFLEAVAVTQPVPMAWCFVHNFDDPYQPRAIQLAVGRGRAFAHDVDRMIERFRREIPRAFESDEYQNKRGEIGSEYDTVRNRLLGDLRLKAHEAGVAVQMTPYGLVTLPLIDGEPVPEQKFVTLPEDVRDALRKRNEDFQSHIRESLKASRAAELDAAAKQTALDQQVVAYVISESIKELIESYADLPDVVDYLRQVAKVIPDDMALFRGEEDERTDAREAMLGRNGGAGGLRKYRVNVLVDSDSDVRGAQVVVELNPTYNNLFGRIERDALFGALHTDFTLIKAGALHRANGGYLVLPIEDVLRSPFSWESLKRALRTRQIQIEDVMEQYGYYATRGLKPQPIPLSIKIVLIGSPQLFEALADLDADFNEQFKVKAAFDATMALDADTIQKFLQFVRTVCQKESLRHVDQEAAALMIEAAIRLAEDGCKVSTHFGMIADTIREANYWAEHDVAPTIGAKHVRQALDQRVYRGDLMRARLQSLIARGTLLIDTKGSAVGQINGLAVVGMGDQAFGRPVRITASVEPGKAGIVDIERESALSGPIHSKGVLILSGYLAYRYGSDMPIALSARLVFEQSYSGIDGDSASSAELYALLSALAGLPLRQDIAVTGSVNQHGGLQAIGGVNQKIEGFFDVCNAVGLTGQQGVLVPASNEQNLMLREDVVQAVAEGRFHVWTAKTIDEGIALLTGTDAGSRDLHGSFSLHTVNGKVERRLAQLTRNLAKLQSGKSRYRAEPTP